MLIFNPELSPQSVSSANAVRRIILHQMASYLQALDGESQHAGRQLGRLLEGEVAPVDDEDETIDLQLRVLDHGLQRQQDGPQNVHKGVSAGVKGQSMSMYLWTYFPSFFKVCVSVGKNCLHLFAL